MGIGHLLHPRPLRPVPPALSLAARFEQNLPPGERHALGAHFTAAPDILKIVGPTIELPWQARIAAAASLAELTSLLAELRQFHVLDPACGCGNFLIIAYQALLHLERQLRDRIAALTPAQRTHRDHATTITSDPAAPSNQLHATAITAAPSVRLSQLHGIDIHPDAAALAIKLLRLARPADADDTSAPDIVVADALFAPWPAVSAIVGNPPFLDARKLARERPDLDIALLKRSFPAVPGRADLCVYFFNKAHDHLREGQRAGLVGTNTIRQNYSREGSLDYILANGGTITDAVATQEWPGDAAVHVSLVNWIKGPHSGPCTLSSPHGSSVVPRISAALTATTDVSSARPLPINQAPFCFEGIQPGHRGFRTTTGACEVVTPYMNGDDLLSGNYLLTPDLLIDLSTLTLAAARKKHPRLVAHLERTVLPDWRRNAAAEHQRTSKTTGEHQNRLARWWQLKRPRPELQKALRALPRYIACSRVTKRPIFAFLASTIKPDSSLTVFAAADDYSFGVLQSSLHWAWFQARCSTLKGDYRYTSNSVFDSFPWPQSPTLDHVQAVARAAVELRRARDHLMHHHGWSLRALYRALEADRAPALRAAQDALDLAVRAAYAVDHADDLAFLLALNLRLAEHPANITAPGLPPSITNPAPFITPDRITATAAPPPPDTGPTKT